MNGLKFNLNKCAVMSFSKNNPLFIYPYKLGDTILRRVHKFIDLGILFKPNLKWKDHIQKSIRKAYSCLWSIILTVGFNSPLTVKKILYNSLVRSIIEFGSLIWSPIDKESIQLLESLQRKATNLITNNAPRWSNLYKNYKTRLIECELLPTTFRREIKDIIFFLKSLNSDTGYNIHHDFIFQTRGPGLLTRNQARGLTLKIPKLKMQSSAQFYPTRFANLWNKLPLGLRELLIGKSDADQIKRILVPYYKDRLINAFDPDDPCTWVLSCRCPRCR